MRVNCACNVKASRRRPGGNVENGNFILPVSIYGKMGYMESLGASMHLSFPYFPSSEKPISAQGTDSQNYFFSKTCFCKHNLIFLEHSVIRVLCTNWKIGKLLYETVPSGGGSWLVRRMRNSLGPISSSISIQPRARSGIIPHSSHPPKKEAEAAEKQEVKRNGLFRFDTYIMRNSGNVTYLYSGEICYAVDDDDFVSSFLLRCFFPHIQIKGD